MVETEVALLSLTAVVDSPIAVVTRKQLADLPDGPGVYFFYNRAGELIYIGKSARLRERVRSYFRPGTRLSRRRRRMARSVATIGYRPLGSELEALLSESRLIKRHRPRHNVQLRSYLNYCFLRLDPNDLYPRLELTRSPRDDGSATFGPFRGREGAEAALEAIRSRWGLRLCEGRLRPREDHPTCVFGQIGKCSRPCDLTVGEANYRAAAQTVVERLRGPPETLLTDLRTERDRAAAELRFEAAALLRDGILAIDRASQRRELLDAAVGASDVVVVQPSVVDRRREVLLIAAGRYRGQLRVDPERLPVVELRRILGEVYRPRDLTDRAARPDEIDELQIVAAWLRRHRDRAEYIRLEGGPDLDAVIRRIGAACAAI